MSERRPIDASRLPLGGVHLIEASAGTGKTHTIVSLILRALVERELSIDKIAAVTFTNAAAAELRQRVGTRLIEAQTALAEGTEPPSDLVLAGLWERPDRQRVRERIERALGELDRVGVFTIHGFAQRMLSDHAFESGARYEVELVGDQARLVYDAVIDFWSFRVARLSEAEFRLHGGSRSFGLLKRIAKEAAAAPDVQLVEFDPAPSYEAVHALLEGPFAAARTLFFEGAEVAYGLLLSDALKKNVYQPPSLAADLRTWRSYFEQGDAGAPLPQGHPRWTQTKINGSIKLKHEPPQHPLFQAIEALGQVREEASQSQRLMRTALRAEMIHFVRARVAGEHQRSRTQSFDDLLLQLRAALRHPERGPRVAEQMREAFPIVLIDEFQDTDPIQYEIFQTVFGSVQGHTALLLIGDPKQSIYAFRGADVHSYLAAGADATAGRWTLTTSYRAGPRVVAAQNALFSGPRSPFGLEAIAYEPVRPAPGRDDELLDAGGNALPGLVVFDTAELPSSVVLERTAHEIARLLARGHTLEGQPLSPGHIAVLTRRNRDAQEVQAALARLRIPAVMHGDRSVFEAPEALELRRILHALAEPSTRGWTRAALVTRFLGVNAAELRAFDDDSTGLELWIERLKIGGEDWERQGVVHALERLAQSTDLVSRTLGEFDGERRITNYRHLVELLHQAETEQHLGVSGLLRFFDAAIADPMGHAMAAEARQLRLESDSEAVTLTTVHKSKGLEYDVVFLPTVGQPAELLDVAATAFRFYDEEAAQPRLEFRDKGDRDASLEKARKEHRQEALRLTYVALTRAKHMVVAFQRDTQGANSKNPPFSPLGYLLHASSAPAPALPEGLGQHLQSMTAEQRQRDQQRVVEASQGAIVFDVLRLADGPIFERPEQTRTLRARPLPEKLSEGERTSSFSAMTRGVDSKLSRASREGRDVDEAVVELLGQSAPEAQSRVVLADFPRGPGPGEALHALFECSPFSEGDAAARQEVVARELGRRGIGSQHLEAALASLEDVLATPLLPSGFRLGQLKRTERRAELEFSLPVGASEARLSASALARALGHGGPPGSLAADYLAEIAELPFSSWSGFLRGFIDLVFDFEGRLYVVDYKSNFLGESYGDYDARALDAAMRQHHYPLQALLYALAVHRHAERRVPNYDYESGFGGVFYLFLRGMKPSFGTQLGVHFSRPSASEIERLSRVMRDPLGGAA